jgi:hypothetical protein
MSNFRALRRFNEGPDLAGPTKGPSQRDKTAGIFPRTLFTDKMETVGHSELMVPLPNPITAVMENQHDDDLNQIEILPQGPEIVLALPAAPINFLHLEEEQDPEIVLALPAAPINLLHLEIPPHDLNALDSQSAEN